MIHLSIVKHHCHYCLNLSKSIIMQSNFNGTIAQSIRLSFVKTNHLYNDSLCENFFVQITIKLKVWGMDVTKTLFHKSRFIRHLIVMPTSSYSHHLHLKERPINLLFCCSILNQILGLMNLTFLEPISYTKLLKVIISLWPFLNI